ncbi:MAG: hypothetical protein RL621_836 [Bacteroidota bacterium]|jgi:N-acylneuraminate cytidylyltransferase
MKVVAFIFARGGSKGLPNKNILSFMGKPLIAWSIEQALSIKRIEKVIVSTDSEEISNVALKYGADVPFKRPKELALDDSPEWLAWRHALSHLLETTGELPEIMLSLPATAPLRASLDIENCLNEYEKGNVDVIITATDAHRSPYFNMVKINKNGLAEIVNPPQSSLTRRQDVPEVYDMTTVCYVANSKFVLNHNGIFEGRVKMVHVPIERAVDIDSLLDFKVAETFLNIRS